MDFQQLADKALQGIIPERDELRAVLDATDEELPELVSAAFKVRRHYYGKRVQIHVLQNAKSGLCPEDCHYCSQSSVSEAPIDRYSFMSKEKLVEHAKQAKAAGAVRFCIVNSGRGPTNKEIDDIAEAVREIRAQTGMNICCSLGLMNEEKIRRLKDVGVGRVNHNLNTAARAIRKLSRRTPMTIASRPLRTSNRPASARAPAASSAWARATRTSSTWHCRYAPWTSIRSRSIFSLQSRKLPSRTKNISRRSVA